MVQIVLLTSTEWLATNLRDCFEPVTLIKGRTTIDGVLGVPVSGFYV